MIDPNSRTRGRGACTRRIAPASSGTKAERALLPAESTTLLGADPPREHANWGINDLKNPIPRLRRSAQPPSARIYLSALELAAAGTTAASVSCAQRSLKPARKLSTTSASR